MTSDVVDRALRDAETLIQTSGPTRAVDRVHTALHGYVALQCRTAGIAYEKSDGMPALFRKLRRDHPGLRDLGPRADDLTRVLNASGAILYALLPLRNRASVAHPNEELLGDEEARLVVNVGRSLVTYLDAKAARGVALRRGGRRAGRTRREEEATGCFQVLLALCQSQPFPPAGFLRGACWAS